MKKITFIVLSVFMLSGLVFAGSLSDIESLAAGSYPRGIAIADFDGNRSNDLLVANFGEDTLIGQDNNEEPKSSIMIFADNKRSDIQAGRSPRGLAAGDLGGGIHADFVATNYADGTVTIVTQKGAQLTTLKAGKYPVGAAIGDADGDKDNDIAVSVYGENKVVIYMTDGKNEWAPVEIAVPGSPTDVAIGKLGNESAIVSANYTAGTVSVIRVRAGTPEKTNDLKTGGGVCKVDIIDVTGDGVNDIVAANFYDNTISVIKVNAAGAFEDQVVYKLNGLHPNGMAAGDINNDGLADVVTANRDSDTLDILTQKDGVLSLAMSITVTADEKRDYGPVEAAIGDLNNDGLADIAFTHMRSNTVRILYQVNIIGKADTKTEFAEAISESNTYNYPNPCVDRTTIRFSLAAPAEVRIIISDLTGKQVWSKTLSAAETRAGINNVEWNVVNDSGIRAANGVYLLNVFAGDKAITKKIAVAK